MASDGAPVRPPTGVDRLRAGPPRGIVVLCAVTVVGTLAVVDYPLELVAAGGLRRVLGASFLLVFSTAPVLLYGLWHAVEWAWKLAAVYYWAVATAALGNDPLVAVLAVGLLGYLHRQRDHFTTDVDIELTDRPPTES